MRNFVSSEGAGPNAARLVKLAFLSAIFLIALANFPANAQTESPTEAQTDNAAPVESDSSAPEQTENPFEGFAGWWSGIGRIGIKNKAAEKVVCRATYFISDDGQNLTQNLRCSTQSFNIDVKSELTHKDGEITGTWHEDKYNVGGTVTGKIEPRGITLFVQGEDIGANMHIITKDKKQIVEIHFEGLDVIGVSILFKKG